VDLVVRTATVDDAVPVADMLRGLGYEQVGDVGDRLRWWTDDPAGCRAGADVLLAPISRA
jgi:hypothetical protein